MADLLLRWAPPELVTPTTINVGVTEASVTLTAGQDYILQMPASVKTGRLRIVGGRNVVIIGGHISLNGAATLGQAIQAVSVTGTLHIEGLLIDRASGASIDHDGIQLGSSTTTNNIVQIQNCRILGLTGTAAGTHADVIQQIDGTELRVHRLTATSNYQGLFVRDSTADVLGKVVLEDVEVAMVEATDVSECLFMYSGASPGPFTTIYEYTNVYLDMPGTRTVLRSGITPNDLDAAPRTASQTGATITWPSLTNITGSVEDAVPVSPMVAATTPGLSYVSPGYRPTAIASSDTVTLSTTESASVTAVDTKSSADALSLTAAESSTIARSGTSADTAAITLSESASVARASTSADTISLTTTESSAVQSTDTAEPKTSSDAATLATTEAATVARASTTANPALLLLPGNGTLAGGDRAGSLTAVSTGALRYAGGKFAGSQALLVEEGTTNLLLNPSAETDLTNIFAASSTLSRVADATMVGSWVARADCSGSAAFQGLYYQTASSLGLTGTRTLRGSCWVRGPVSVYVQAWVFYTDGTDQSFGRVLATVGSTWQRVSTDSFSPDPAKTVNYVQCRVRTDTAQAVTFSTDAAQLEEKSYVTSYADGSLGTGYTWAGIAHASTSSRSETTVKVDDTARIDSQRGSMATWVYRDGAAQEAFAVSLGAFGAAGVDWFGVSLFGGTDEWQMRWKTGALGITSAIIPGAVPVGSWHFVYAGWDGTAFSIAANGGALVAGTRDAPAGTFGTSDLTLGGSTLGGGFFNGRVSPVMTFDRPLTNEEQATLYQRTTPWALGMLAETITLSLSETSTLVRSSTTADTATVVVTHTSSITTNDAKASSDAVTLVIIDMVTMTDLPLPVGVLIARPAATATLGSTARGASATVTSRPVVTGKLGG